MLQSVSPPPRPRAKLRRSLLFVPGADPRKLKRADSADADTLVFDLEDSVEPASKERARAQVAERLIAARGDAELVVRVNGLGTPHFERDVLEMVTAGARSLMLPKSAPETLAAARRYLASVEERLSLSAGAVGLLALVETANGIARLPGLLDEAERIDALCFGNADFSLDMGLRDAGLSSGAPFHARCSLAITAAAAGVPAIDGVCLAVRDEDAFASEARAALELGFAGKLCIHPAQVAIANEVFTPTPAQIDWARRVVAASASAAGAGRGVFALDGKMVDGPVVALQRRLLDRARRAGALDSSADERGRGRPDDPSAETRT